VRVGSSAVAAADRDALGTTARIVVWPPEHLPRLLRVVDDELASIDQQASRFRSDSEISAVHEAARRHPGQGRYLISDGLAEAVRVALAAARWTRGLTDPTVGAALISLGYDRDFAAIEPGPAAPPPARAPGWRAVRLAGNVLTLRDGVMLDLGATAKGLGADRAARAAYAAVVLARGATPEPPRAAAGCSSASVATSRWRASRRLAAGRSLSPMSTAKSAPSGAWPSRRRCPDGPTRSPPSRSGWPAAGSRPHRPRAGSGCGLAR